MSSVSVVSMAAARARRVDQVRVTQLLLAPTVSVLQQRTVVLARDGLAGDWAAILDRQGGVLAATADTLANRGRLLAAIAWGRAEADGDHVVATMLADQHVALVVGRRDEPFSAGERDRLGVLAGMATVVWGHLDGAADTDGAWLGA
jgi:hypothetical protein